MTSKERVIAAVEFKGPDQLPHRHCFLPATYEKYPAIIQLLQAYPSDFAGEEHPEDRFLHRSNIYRRGKWTDEWHCQWTVLQDGMMGQVTGHPLEDFEMLHGYQWPKASSVDLSKAIQSKDTDKYLMTGGLTLFERLIDLRGFENTMADIALCEPQFLQIRDRVVNYNLELIDRLLEQDPDGIGLSDDWGSQISLIISPESWRKLFLPAYKKMFRRIRDAGKHVFFHSDGYTMDILPDLADAGVNIFWIDLTVNPLKLLREQLGGKVCFQGLTDVQFVMRWGTPAEVKKHGQALIEALAGFNGGFIACSEADPDQPWENIAAIYDAFQKYGPSCKGVR